jgi:transposase-like protein
MEPTTEDAPKPAKKPTCPPARHRENEKRDEMKRLFRGVATYICADCGEQFDVDSSG